MMLTTAFLHQHGLAELYSRYAIKASRGKVEGLVLLKYEQLNSPMHEPIVQECRGLVLDERDGWRVVARAYDKFFNYGESQAAAVDWSTVEVLEKLDGSLMVMYFHDGKWCVASSGLPDASGNLNGGTRTFASLFWETFRGLGYQLPDAKIHGERCFIFELMTAANRVIVHHANPRLVLHGVRDRVTMAEERPEKFAQAYGWECVNSFPLDSIDSCVAAAKALDPMRAEGYVVRDASFRRIKVKSPQYVALTHLKEAMSGRRLLEIIRVNESDEFLSYFPEWKSAYAMVNNALDRLCAQVDAAYQQIAGIEDQKAFAAEATKTPCFGPLFARRKGVCKNAREFYATCSFATLERAIGIDLKTADCVGQRELPAS